MNKKVLITGITGYIGKNIAKYLSKKDYEVYGLVHKTRIDPELKSVVTSFLLYDESPEQISRFCVENRIRTIIHLAAYQKTSHSVYDIDQYLEANIRLGIYCLEALCGENNGCEYRNDIREFICVGTSWQHYNQKTYDAVNFYAATKEAFDRIVDFYCNAYGIRAITLELYETYGSSDNRNKLLNLFKKNKPGDALAMAPGDTVLDMVYIDDIVRGFEQAIKVLDRQDDGSHKTYALSSREYHSIKEIIKIFESVYDKRLDVELGAIPYTSREMMEPYKSCEILPGWTNDYSLEEGLKKMKTEDDNLETCRFCGQPLTTTCVDLGLSPLSNEYMTQNELKIGQHYYPLIVKTCSDCFLTQTTADTPPEGIFHNYQYFSSYSSSWVKHAEEYVDMITERQGLTKNSIVAEVACNDGYLLQFFVKKGIPCYGVEPAENVAESAEKKGINVYKMFFNAKTARDLSNQGRTVDLLIGNNVLAHVPDINSFLSGTNAMLKDQGIATFEFPHLLRLMQNREFDTVYHEHYSYLSLVFLQRATEENGLRIFDVEELNTHGGSLRVYICKRDSSYTTKDSFDMVLSEEIEYGMNGTEIYSEFNEIVKKTKMEITQNMVGLKREGSTIAAYGAAAKGNTLLNYCGIGRDYINYVVDANPHKQGLYLPGTQIPIVDIEHMKANPPDYVVILPWNIKDEIMNVLKEERLSCKFITLIPEFRIFE